MRRFLTIVSILFAVSTCHGAGLPRATPESQGVSSRDVLAFVEAADRTIDSLHSFMLVRHGHVVAEGWWAPYVAEAPHSLYSLSKSFTSTAVGLTVGEGKLSLDDEVVKLFPEDAPPSPDTRLKAMRVRDLLRMVTGHQTEPPRKQDEPWARTFLAHTVPFKPGSHFLYNTSATYMLSAAVQKATGRTTLDYLTPRLFEPLGIRKPTWEASPQGISAGGFGLSVRTDDIAKFGQLYLQKGEWGGRRLLPAGWVEEASARQTSNGSNPKSDWDQGYGYQFWRCRHGAYRADGAFGQYCIVLPEQEAVIAITGGVANMQAVLDLVWDRLLPAFRQTSLDPDEPIRAKLEGTLKGLSLRTPEGAGKPAEGANRKYILPANDRKLESLSLETGAANGDPVLITRAGGVEHRVVCGAGRWRTGRAAWGRLPEQQAAACGAWTADGTFTAKICFPETPFVLTARLTFSGNEVRCESWWNVGFLPTAEAPLVGKAE
jgi:CubicO group peptidase (beta-lactamase class C family)